MPGSKCIPLVLAFSCAHRGRSRAPFQRRGIRLLGLEGPSHLGTLAIQEAALTVSASVIDVNEARGAGQFTRSGPDSTFEPSRWHRG